jgi:hypothetical protein
MHRKLSRNLSRTLYLLLLLPLAALGQTTWTGTNAALSTNGDIALTMSQAVCWTATGALVSCGSGATFNEHWPGLETRKDNGRGITLAALKTSGHTVSLAPAGYIQAAKQIGLEPEEAEILQAINDAGLRVYDFKKVDDYLYREALKQSTRTRWVWKPMREADLKNVWNDCKDTTGCVYATQYDKEVPLRAIADAKRILDCAPAALFLISDYETVKPDPFLAVTTKRLLSQGKIWIIDQWDEPGFEPGSEVNGTPEVNSRTVVEARR